MTGVVLATTARDAGAVHQHLVGDNVLQTVDVAATKRAPALTTVLQLLDDPQMPNAGPPEDPRPSTSRTRLNNIHGNRRKDSLFAKIWTSYDYKLYEIVEPLNMGRFRRLRCNM